jgi:cytochrome c-type biogenesis protein CcmE
VLSPRASRALKIIATILVVGGGTGYLLYSTGAEGLEYYKHVDEVAGALSSWQGKRLQLHGRVVAGSIERRRGALEYRFVLAHGGKSLPVHYSGVVPDTFKDEAEVVAKGRLDAGGALEATEILAKCPSKYEAQPPPKTAGR